MGGFWKVPSTSWTLRQDTFMVLSVPASENVRCLTNWEHLSIDMIDICPVFSVSSFCYKKNLHLSDTKKNLHFCWFQPPFLPVKALSCKSRISLPWHLQVDATSRSTGTVMTKTIWRYVYIYIYIYLLYIYLFTYIYIYICMYVCMYVCMYGCMHACMHVCMYVWF